MQNYVPASIFFCLMLCLSSNYTFSLHRASAVHTTNPTSNSNRHGRCSSAPAGATGPRPNRDSPTTATSTDSLNPRNFIPGSLGNSNLSGDDLRQYEQMVIMKKYPYLDLKDVELKFHAPSGKNVRHNARFAADRNFGNEQAICEPIEDGLNVEIFNRGLSGFAIPQLKVTDARQIADKDVKKSHVLDSLKDDIKEFEGKIYSKIRRI